MSKSIYLVLDMENDLVHADGPNGKSAYGEQVRERRVLENTRRATYVQREYAIRNPLGFEGYGAYLWGITASEGPGWVTQRRNGVVRQFLDYAARGVPDGPDDGTISPWVVIASLPFVPKEGR